MTATFKDDLDRRLVALLQTNARDSTTNLARRLGVARTTVHERIARLERDGLITGYSVVLSRNPAVERVQALVMLAVRQKQSRQVVDRLRGFPEVKTCLTVNGEYDLFLVVETARLEDLDVVLDEIAEVPGIERTASSIVLASKFDRRYREVAQQLAEQLAPPQSSI
ncbi:MAG: Lrp/AsnC family transcriptional regulator [Hyphomicrobiales bacterium]|nr:Lrp/AsnC family transcriptional regulator [Hyphomicrobiales bacterium]MCP5370380.1 Lrp/AsnC family transcriptional regulator [Hyphomicrobiales bacterium]